MWTDGYCIPYCKGFCSSTVIKPNVQLADSWLWVIIHYYKYYFPGDGTSLTEETSGFDDESITVYQSLIKCVYTLMYSNGSTVPLCVGVCVQAPP